MQQVARTITVDEALGAFVKLARGTRMTGDEHDQFILYTKVLKAEIDEGTAAKQELAKLKEEHDKCPKQPNSANPSDGSVGSEGNGTNLGKDGGSVEPPVAVQESLQRSNER
jgi:hypothetical protein